MSFPSASVGAETGKKGLEEKNRVGFTFVPEPGVGKGYLWTYPINAACSLTIYDVVFYQDMSFHYHHPAALTVAVSSPSSAEPALTKPCTNPENLVGYFLEEGTFGHTIPKKHSCPKYWDWPDARVLRTTASCTNGARNHAGEESGLCTGWNSVAP